MLTKIQHRGRGLPKKGGGGLECWRMEGGGAGGGGGGGGVGGGGTWQEREGDVFEG